MKKYALGLFFLLAICPLMAQKIDTDTGVTAEEPVVVMETTLGTIKVRLYKETPRHRDNFVKLVREGMYDGLLFHRVIPEFMVQAGDPDSRNAQAGQPLGVGTLGYTVPAEFNYKYFHKKGALCAARQGDAVNPQKASSATQFYIVQGRVFDHDALENMARRRGRPFTVEQVEAYTTEGGTPFLDGEYTVFGEVIEGMDVVDKIAAQRRDRMDRPMEDVKIVRASVVEEKKK
ncbi:MAG: peptidylprolyl isomerase [Bacteroidales bacterium]|nr:peptidylprolyl isomerase [Bacteroidales bacterium]